MMYGHINKTLLQHVIKMRSKAIVHPTRIHFRIVDVDKLRLFVAIVSI